MNPARTMLKKISSRRKFEYIMVISYIHQMSILIYTDVLSSSVVNITVAGGPTVWLV